MAGGEKKCPGNPKPLTRTITSLELEKKLGGCEDGGEEKFM
jgi:hypothetical protein